MPRIRYIKSEFWKDEDIAELTHQERLFYIGLWNFADKAGRIEDRAKWLKVEIFPYENADTEKMLKELSKRKVNSRNPFIQRYIVDGIGYIQILSWAKHQKPHHQEQESKIPEPPPLTLTETLTVNGNGDGECASSKLGEDAPKIHRTNTEVISKKKKTFDFEVVWVIFPNKIGKKEAMGHFNITVKTEEDFNNCLKAVHNYIKYLEKNNVESKYIKSGCNWFADWEPWTKYEEPKPASSSKRASDVYVHPSAPSEADQKRVRDMIKATARDMK